MHSRAVFMGVERYHLNVCQDALLQHLPGFSGIDARRKRRSGQHRINFGKAMRTDEGLNLPGFCLKQERSSLSVMRMVFY